MKMTLSEVKARVEQLAKRIGAPQDLLPTYGFSEHTARPHIEVDSRGYHYVIAERGEEFERHTSFDIDQLLYKIFANVTFDLSTQFELSHRIESQDCRRIIFQHQVELLSMLAPEWGEQEAQAHEQILKRNPFDDYAGIRATLTRNLREEGNSPEVAWELACEHYPLPKSL